jgi:ABC-type Fe3+ transport system permease subunit
MGVQKESAKASQSRGAERMRLATAIAICVVLIAVFAALLLDITSKSLQTISKNPLSFEAVQATLAYTFAFVFLTLLLLIFIAVALAFAELR